MMIADTISVQRHGDNFKAGTLVSMSLMFPPTNTKLTTFAPKSSMCNSVDTKILKKIQSYIESYLIQLFKPTQSWNPPRELNCAPTKL